MKRYLTVFGILLFSLILCRTYAQSVSIQYKDIASLDEVVEAGNGGKIAGEGETAVKITFDDDGHNGDYIELITFVNAGDAKILPDITPGDSIKDKKIEFKIKAEQVSGISASDNRIYIRLKGAPKVFAFLDLPGIPNGNGENGLPPLFSELDTYIQIPAKASGVHVMDNSFTLYYDYCGNSLSEEIYRYKKKRADYKVVIPDSDSEKKKLAELDNEILALKEKLRTAPKTDKASARKDLEKKIGEQAQILRENNVFTEYVVQSPKRIFARVGFPITLKVVNVNPFIYNVYISSKYDTLYDPAFAQRIYDAILAATNSEAVLRSLDGEDGSAYWLSYLVALSEKINSYITSRKTLSVSDCSQLKFLESDHRNFLYTVDTLIKKTGFSSYKQIIGSIDTAIVRKEEKKIVNIIRNFETAYNIRFDNYLHVPQVKNRDELQFSLSIINKDTVIKNGNVVNEKIHVPIKYGFAIDGSVGLFCSGLHSPAYFYKAETVQMEGSPVTGYRIMKQKQPAAEFGALLLTHFYKRWGIWVNGGLSIGAGITFSNTPKPRYFAGGSLLLGRRSRMSITGGVVLGEVTEFRPYMDYESFVISNNDADNTYKRLNASYFISFSYNLPYTGGRQRAGNNN